MGYGISFDVRGTFSLTNSDFGEEVVIFSVDMSSSDDDKNNDILFLGNGPTKVLHKTTLTAQTQYSILLILSNKAKHFFLSLHYTKCSSYLFVKAIKIYQSKVKDSELIEYLDIFLKKFQLII